jgi:hypothetical protein
MLMPSEEKSFGPTGVPQAPPPTTCGRWQNHGHWKNYRGEQIVESTMGQVQNRTVDIIKMSRASFQQRELPYNNTTTASKVVVGVYSE